MMLHSFYIWLASTFEFFAIRFLEDLNFSSMEKVGFICAHSAKKNSSSIKDQYPYIVNSNFLYSINCDVLFQIMKSSCEETLKLVKFFRELGPRDIASTTFCTMLGDHPERGARRFVEIILSNYEKDNTEDKTVFRVFINGCGLETKKGLAHFLIVNPCTSTAKPLLITLKDYFSPTFRSKYIQYWVCYDPFVNLEKCADFFETNKAHFTKEELDFVTKELARRRDESPEFTKEDSDMTQQAHQFIEAKIDIYAKLGIKQNARHEEVKKAFRAKALLSHPDKNPTQDDEEFKQLNNMYKVILHPVGRDIYDKNYKKIKQGATDQTHNFASSSNL